MARMLRRSTIMGASVIIALLSGGGNLGGVSGASAASPGFHLIFDSQFKKPSLNARWWTRYDGVDGCCKMTLWRKSHIELRHGQLILDTYRDAAAGGRWATAGVSMGRSLNQTYGRWSVRFRMGAGRGTAVCMMLWPKRGWPPEIDFAEEGPRMGGARHAMTSTLHYSSRNSMIHRHVSANFTKWHVMGVRWTPGKIIYSIDGRVWARITGRHVPARPMHLAIQSEVGPKGSDGTRPSSATPSHVRLRIDWVRIYRYR